MPTSRAADLVAMVSILTGAGAAFEEEGRRAAADGKPGGPRGSSPPLPSKRNALENGHGLLLQNGISSSRNISATPCGSSGLSISRGCGVTRSPACLRAGRK
jgi:hypothetical protein